MIYFTKALASLSAEKQIEFVLHEQAHRLKRIFRKKSLNERFAVAWGSTFASYLKDPSDKEGFYKILKTNNISTRNSFDPKTYCKRKDCFPNEKMRKKDTSIKKQKFSSVFSVLVKPADIITFGLGKRNKYFNLYFDAKSIFKNYPILQEYYQDSFSLRTLFKSEAEYQVLLLTAQNFVTANETIVLNLEVLFDKKVKVQNGKPTVAYSNFDIEKAPTFNLSDIRQELSLFKLGGNTSLESPNIFIDSDSKSKNKVIKIFKILEQRLLEFGAIDKKRVKYVLNKMHFITIHNGSVDFSIKIITQGRDHSTNNIVFSAPQDEVSEQEISAASARIISSLFNEEDYLQEESQKERRRQRILLEEKYALSFGDGFIDDHQGILIDYLLKHRDANAIISTMNKARAFISFKTNRDVVINFLNSPRTLKWVWSKRKKESTIIIDIFIPNILLSDKWKNSLKGYLYKLTLKDADLRVYNRDYQNRLCSNNNVIISEINNELVINKIKKEQYCEHRGDYKNYYSTFNFLWTADLRSDLNRFFHKLYKKSSSQSFDSPSFESPSLESYE